MILEHEFLFQRSIAFQSKETYYFDKTAQRALFLSGLAKGGALVSPDELSFFRSGCELNTPEEWNIYYGLSGFATSSLLLAEHRLFGTYHGLSFIKEASLQIAVSTLYTLHELLNTVTSAIGLGFNLLCFTLEPYSELKDSVIESAKSVLVHAVKTVASIGLFITGVVGALITRPLSTLLNPAVSSDADIDDKAVEKAQTQIGSENYELVRNSMFAVQNSTVPRGAGSRLEQVIGSLSDVVDELPELASTQIPLHPEF